LSAAGDRFISGCCQRIVAVAMHNQGGDAINRAC
jgi:hypothetical protein